MDNNMDLQNYRISDKGKWVVERMKEIDSEAFEDMNLPLDTLSTELMYRRGKAFLQALDEWDKNNDP